jgi:hypothetical protein
MLEGQLMSAFMLALPHERVPYWRPSPARSLQGATFKIALKPLGGRTRNYIVRRRVLSGTVDHVVANRRRLCAVKRHGKRRHAAFLEGSIEHNAVPGINGDERGPAKIWDNAAGHRVFAMAHAAEAAEQRLSGSHGRRVGGGSRRIKHELRLGWQRGQTDPSTKLEHQTTAAARPPAAPYLPRGGRICLRE